MVDKQVNHAHYGEIIYDAGGLLVCHICGKGGFRALGHHVRQVHLDVVANMREYKEMFGLDLKKGILIEETRKIKAEKVWENATILNLVSDKSIDSRFKKGDKGRTKDMVSEQTKRMLINRIAEGRQVGFIKRKMESER